MITAKDILTNDEIEEIYKDIRTNPKYVKHAQLQQKYKAQGKLLQAALEGKILKEMEIAVFEMTAREYIKSHLKMIDLDNQMTEDDRKKVKILSSSLYMLSDVVTSMILEINSTLSKYTKHKLHEFDNLQNALKESKVCISRFDNRMNDEKISSLFGDCADNLYELIYNKSSSYQNKLEKYLKTKEDAKGANKKVKRNAEVA